VDIALGLWFAVTGVADDLRRRVGGHILEIKPDETSWWALEMAITRPQDQRILF
jgi:hypothetical protein